MVTATAPKKLVDAHLKYLDRLRASGAVNMFGAAPHLQRAFLDHSLSPSEARAILTHWLDTFAERSSDEIPQG